MLGTLDSMFSQSEKQSLTLLVRSKAFQWRNLTWQGLRPKNMHLLVYGSFNEDFGLPGAYLAGPSNLITELRYTSRGYMFTTSIPTYIVEMVRLHLVDIKHN